MLAHLKIGRPSWIWEKKAKKPAVSQDTDHLEGWLYWWKAMASLHISEKILISHLVLHYFRYKMAAEVCQYLRGSSSAHRLDGPHVLYIKITVWVPWWWTCQFFFGHLGFWRKWQQQKKLFTAVSQHPDHIEGWLFWWKLTASLHIGHKILILNLVLHYFRYKMAAEISLSFHSYI